MATLESNSTNLIVRDDDGNVELIPKSDRNEALFQHGLWDVVREGDETWMKDGVTVVPHDDTDNYSLMLSGNADPLQIGPHQKEDLVKAMIQACEEDSDLPLRKLYGNIREDMVRTEAMRALASTPVFDDVVEVEDDGWLIHGSLKLTWEGEFYHPRIASKAVQSDGVSERSKGQAYSINPSSLADDMSRGVTIDGENYYLTDSEMEFLASAIWAIENAPRV